MDVHAIRDNFHFLKSIYNVTANNTFSKQLSQISNFRKMDPIAYNLTEAFSIVDSVDPAFMQFIFMSVMFAAGNVNQECWLEFPISGITFFFLLFVIGIYKCTGCEYSVMAVQGLNKDVMSTLYVFQSLCDVIDGKPSLTPVSSIVLDDLTLLKKLRQSALYEPKVRPNFPNHPETIYVGFRLIAVENLDPVDSSFRIDCSLSQEWYDHRLSHPYDLSHLDLNTEDTKLWYPDTYFVQSRHGTFNRMTKGISVKVRSDGLVHMSLRMAIKVSCSMDFHNFPLDIQRCILNLESYGYNAKDVRYKWKEDQRSKYYQSQVLSLYHLKPLGITERITPYVLGDWSTLELEFVFVRNSIIFIPALYFPCAMVVIVSWITFVLQPDHYPARTYLCVTSMLTILTIQAAMDKSIPQVSYVKAIDEYVLVCIFFIAGTFFEYACVLQIRFKRRAYVNKRNEKMKIYEKKKRELQRNKKNIFSKTTRTKCKRTKNIISEETMTNEMLTQDRVFITKYDRIKLFYLREGWPVQLDLYSRFVFPAAFTLFNIIYWVSTGDNIENVRNM